MEELFPNHRVLSELDVGTLSNSSNSNRSRRLHPMDKKTTTAGSMLQSDTTTTKNNYVAISDYRAALNGIENRFHDIAERLEGRDQELAYATLLDATRESLIHNLDRIVQPLEHDDYHQILNPNQNDDDDDQDNDDDSVDTAALDDNEDDPDDDDEDDDNITFASSSRNDRVIDEDDLIDTDAVRRVTQLRSEIRVASHQLAVFRDAVTEKALQLADQEMRLAHAASGVTVDFQDESHQPDQEIISVSQLREDFAAVIQQTQQQPLHPDGEGTTLYDHLQQLTNNLNQLDLETPAQALQETLETVETTQQEPLSQTERAIRSRTNEGMHFSHQMIEDPVERFNLFLG